MFKKSLFKISSVVAMALSIVACGGGSDHDGTGSSGISYVPGEFKSVSETGMVYADVDSGGVWCVTNSPDRYFETEKVIVLGSDSLPEDDFRHMATHTQLGFENVIAKMGVTEQEFKAMKPYYSSMTRNAIYGYVNNVDYIDVSWVDEFPELAEFYETADVRRPYSASDLADAALAQAEGGDGIIIERLFEGLWGIATHDQQIALFEVGMERGLILVDPQVNIKMPSKVLVCLDEQRSMAAWGEGTSVGFDVMPKSVGPRNDDASIVRHELIHHVQINIMNPARGGAIADRWFGEGQAVYLSGMTYTQGSHGRNPTLVRNDMDELIHYVDVGQAYQDYGQAYEFIENVYGKQAISDMMQAARHDVTNVRFGVGFGDLIGDTDVFTVAFNSEITDIEELRLNYPSLH